MYARKIQEKEYSRTEELMAIAFEFPSKTEKTPDQLLEQVKTAPKNRVEAYFAERWAVFEDEEMAACFSAVPFPIQFDGSVCTMGGVGGVSSLPQSRGKGAVRMCFREAFRDMYDSGQLFSYLYPFSTRFYRQFGYEQCGEQIRYKLDLRAIPREKTSGSARLLEKGNLTQDMVTVYREYTKAYNLAVAREDIDFLWTKEANPAADGRYVYVCYNGEGRPCGSLDFTKEKVGDSYDMRCRQFWFLGREGFLELSALIQSFSSFYQTVSFPLPMDLELSSLLPEWSVYPCTRVLEYLGMARAINVRAILESAAYRGSGRFTLEIRDEFLPENNQCFAVEFTDGKAVSVTSTDTAEVSMTPGQFASLILGFLPSGCPIPQGEIWSRVFYSKPLFIDDHF